MSSLAISSKQILEDKPKGSKEYFDEGHRDDALNKKQFKLKTTQKAKLLGDTIGKNAERFIRNALLSEEDYKKLPLSERVKYQIKRILPIVNKIIQTIALISIAVFLFLIFLKG